MMRLMILAVLPWLAACVTWPAEAAPVHFSLTDMGAEGGRYDSAGFMGQPMVLEFYFDGCRYCRENAPNVKALSTERHDQGAQVVEISIDCDLADYANWLARYAADGPVLNDCSGDVGQSLGVSSYPTTIVLDRNHVRVWSSVGVWSSAKKAKIRQLISN
jgi:peroxiredoxin